MEREISRHIGEERLEAYVLHSMDEEETALVEEHLLFCLTCQDQLEAVEGYVRAMTRAAKRIRKEEELRAPAKTGVLEWLRAWFHSPAPIWAGALAATCLILMYGLLPTQKPGPPINVELHATR